MANNTDTGVAPTGDDDFGGGAATRGRDFDHPSGPPFGDPDQFLYGGSGRDSVSFAEPTAPTNSQYEGRHRAAD
jgi:hypothetical protein